MEGEGKSNGKRGASEDAGPLRKVPAVRRSPSVSDSESDSSVQFLYSVRTENNVSVVDFGPPIRAGVEVEVVDLVSEETVSVSSNDSEEEQDSVSAVSARSSSGTDENETTVESDDEGMGSEEWIPSANEDDDDTQ